MICDSKTQTKLLCALAGDKEFFEQNINKLRLSDFPSNSVRIVFETLKAHYERYETIPTANVFPDEVLNALRGIGPDGKDSITTTVPESSLRSVASCLGRVVVALSNQNSSDTLYFKDRLKEYLSSVRLCAMDGASMSSAEQLEQAYRIKEEIDSITGGERKGLAKSARTRIVCKKKEQPKRFGTGVWPIDIRTKMGLELGEVGIVLASSGVGKSNMLINFAVNTALRGQRVLFMTLEISDEVVLRRMHAMMGNFKMSTMDKPEEEWPKDDLARYNYMLSDEFHNIDYVTVNYEYVSKSPTCEDIDREIENWKKDMKKDGLSDDMAPLVIIDYIRQINPGRLATKNDNTNTKLGAIMQEIKRMAMKHNCVIWTAQQVTRRASNKEHITKDDIADSIAIINHCDVALGFVPVNSNDQRAPTTQETEDDTVENHSDKERLMNVDFVKLRNSGETGSFCTVFQGKSLKLWTSEKYANAVEGIIKSVSKTGDYSKFFGSMKPKVAST